MEEGGGPRERAALNYVLADELVLAVRLDLRDVELRGGHVAVLVEGNRDPEDGMRDLDGANVLREFRPRRLAVCARGLVGGCSNLRRHIRRRAERAPLRPVLLVVPGDDLCCARQAVDVAGEGRDVCTRAREVTRVEAVGAEDLRALPLLLHLLREELAVRGDLPREEDDGGVI